MGFYAVIKGNLVDSVVIADTPLEADGTWIDVTNMDPRPGRDWTYENGVFTRHDDREKPIKGPSFLLNKLQMISRFTTDEYISIVSATKTDPAVQAWYDMFQVAGIIDLTDKRTIDGVNFLASKNLITQARATEILHFDEQ